MNLERTNIGELNPNLVPETVDVITVDLSYLSLAEAIPQLEAVSIADDAELVALVKPTFELRRPRPPRTPLLLREAVDRAAAGIGRAPWNVLGVIASPVRGVRGSLEFLLHARRRDEANRPRRRS